MNQIIQLHPVLNHFLSCFKPKNIKPSSFFFDEFEIINMEKFTLAGSYFVCAAKTILVAGEFIHCKGPGGALIGGTNVELEAPEIILEGSPNEPIQLVAIESFSVKATDLKMQNVIFYLFENAGITINTQIFSKVKNVCIIRLSLDDKNLIQEEIEYWKDEQALDTFMNRQKISSERDHSC